MVNYHFSRNTFGLHIRTCDQSLIFGKREILDLKKETSDKDGHQKAECMQIIKEIQNLPAYKMFHEIFVCTTKPSYISILQELVQDKKWHFNEYKSLKREIAPRSQDPSGAICVDRNDEQGIKEAVADLLSLSRCNYIHSYSFIKIHSRFSAVARNIFI